MSRLDFAVERFEAALQAGVPARTILDEGMLPAMAEVGRLFEEGEFFVPEMLVSARAMKSGLGCHALQVGDLKVGALVAVNCLGDVVDPLSGKKIAGPLNEDRRTLADTEALMIDAYAEKRNLFSGNTTIGVIATNVALTKAQATKLASMAHDGYGRTMRPAHSMADGDTIFAMSTGPVAADLSVVGLLAARVMERAVVAAAARTQGRGGAAAVPGAAGAFGGHDAGAGAVLWPSVADQSVGPGTPGRYLPARGDSLADGRRAAGGIRGDPNSPGAAAASRPAACARRGASIGRHPAPGRRAASKLAQGLLPDQVGCPCGRRAGSAAPRVPLRASECVA